MSNKNPKKPTPPSDFDREAFKRAIAFVESSGGQNLDNPNSSAAGKYHFLYRYLKSVPEMKGVSKREFINSPDLQEKIMDMAIDGTLKGFPSYEGKARSLKGSYDTNLRLDEIAALTHFLGSGGVEKFLSQGANYEVPGDSNADVTTYLTRFNEGLGTDPGFVQDPVMQSKTTVENDGLFAPEALGDQLPNGEFNVGEPTIKKEEIYANEYLIGGMINTNDNDLVEFEGGGTHEENPLGGIPQGVGENGKLNTVEEDETKFSFDDGDYVFSNRIAL